MLTSLRLDRKSNAKEQTLLVITDHCQSFKDVHACRMELMYGPYQVAMANDVDAFNDSMEKMTTENIQEISAEARSTDNGG